MPRAPSITSSLIRSPEQYLVRSTSHEAPRYVFFSILLLFHLRTKYSTHNVSVNYKQNIIVYKQKILVLYLATNLTIDQQVSMITQWSNVRAYSVGGYWPCDAIGWGCLNLCVCVYIYIYPFLCGRHNYISVYCITFIQYTLQNAVFNDMKAIQVRTNTK
jgi:hypothetical protein